MTLQELAIRILHRVYCEFRLLCWKCNSKFRKSITVSTKQGIFTVMLTGSDVIGRSLYCYGQYELDLMSQTLTFLRSMQKCPQKGIGTIVDIGANNGVISIGMLYTGEMERAIAIEPEPKNFSLLQHNVRQNGLLDRIVCIPKAVSNQAGDIQFELSNTNIADHRVRMDLHIHNPELYHESERHVITVKSDWLDNLLAALPGIYTQDIALIWIDVEGHEGYAFSGARDLLSKDIPVVCEIWPYAIRRAGMSQEDFVDIVKSIWSYYWVMRSGKFVRYPIHTLDILFDELGYDDVLNDVVSLRYTNVIFTH